MPYVKHVIPAINVFDITVIVVAPTDRPSLVVSERVAVILEAVIPADHPGTPHVERVVVAEMGTVIGVGNSAIVATTTATVVSNGLGLLPCGPLCLLGVLGLRRLGTLWLRLTLGLLSALGLRLLGTLWLRLALCLLGALGLRLLGTLRLRLVLGLLGALGLRL